MPQRSYDTPFGTLCLTADETALTSVRWGVCGVEDSSAVLDQAVQELAEYLDGARTDFDVEMRVDKGPFQRAVCDAMRAIPFGETTTYGAIGKALDAPAQAVGQACGGNPIPIFIPCHRVMGAHGKLTGFSGAGGVETKVALLKHECAGGFLI